MSNNIELLKESLAVVDALREAIITDDAKKKANAMILHAIPFEVKVEVALKERSNAHGMMLSALEAIAGGMLETQGFIPNFLDKAIITARKEGIRPC